VKVGEIPEGNLRRFGDLGLMGGTLSRIAVLTVALFALFSFDFRGLAVSQTLLSDPLRLLMVAFIDTVVLGFFVSTARSSKLRAGGSVFAVFYGGNYLLTALESAYLGSILPLDLVIGLVVNGLIVSAAFAAALVLALGKGGEGNSAVPRLSVGAKEWVWKFALSGAVYLLLFMAFGLAVYYPIAKALDPVAFAAEQGAASSAAAFWVLPLEYVGGMLWVVLAVPVILAVTTVWKKTALVVGLLFAVPVSCSMLLSGMSIGLTVAHATELFGENFAFGAFAVWLLHLRNRLPG